VNTYDVETFLNPINHHHTPYCVVFLLNQRKFFIYYHDSKNILIESLIIIFSQIKISTTTIFYIHKLNFDGTLLIDALTHSKKFQFSLFTRESDIYSIKIFNEKKIIEFRCSKKILPLSLKNIALLFNLPPKLPFPYKFASLDVLNYRGPTPKLEFFNSKED
jgi:hypothetical protein